MEQLVNILDEIIYQFKLERFEGLTSLSKIAKKYSVHPKQFIRGGVSSIGMFALFIVFLFARNFVYTLLSVAYPAFLTIRAISNEDLLSRDGKLYMSYWACFALMKVFTGTFDFVFHFLPFSYFLQCVFTMWLYSTKTRGAEIVNKFVFRPVLAALGQISQEKTDQGNDVMRKQSGNY